MALQNIGPVENFPVNQGVAVEVAGKRIAVFNATGQFYATDDVCPHRGGTLSGGSMSGMTVICPLHGAEIDVRTGMCGPPAAGSIETYDVSSDSKSLFIEI
jgi:3-phenylpropionate/trans-cinnamate dioxygenase ferredoxin subunit